ncbi:hypothetical protein [Acinetobacter haemolyticus]|uniref:hypothetical protein n=1 Tax=Acinetobacter haemolyticus TaxID=29430 RepID=UPI003AF6D75E
MNIKKLSRSEAFEKFEETEFYIKSEAVQANFIALSVAFDFENLPMDAKQRKLFVPAIIGSTERLLQQMKIGIEFLINAANTSPVDMQIKDRIDELLCILASIPSMNLGEKYLRWFFSGLGYIAEEINQLTCQCLE